MKTPAQAVFTPSRRLNPIPVFLRSVYGDARVFIADPDMAREFRETMNRENLRATDIADLQAQGFTFQSVPDPELPNESAGD